MMKLLSAEKPGLAASCSRAAVSPASTSEPRGPLPVLRQRVVHQGCRTQKAARIGLRTSSSATDAGAQTDSSTADVVAKDLDKASAPSASEYGFVCPICLTSRLTVARSAAGSSSSLACGRCRRTFEDAGAYVDLTLTAGARPSVYQQPLARSVELFRSPVVSFVYERGWRQGFASAGFPGPDEEFGAASRLLQPAQGGLLLDMSCGSGLFTRRFIKSGLYMQVVGADFSENMLRQTQQFIADDATIAPSAYCLLRADVARLPFATGSVAGVHAGAAIHCWPDPQAALAEISRVLAPGGVFVGTTFLNTFAPLGELLGDDTIRPLSQALDPLVDPRRSAGMKTWEEAELKELAQSVGLTGFSRIRSSRYIMFSASKPAEV